MAAHLAWEKLGRAVVEAPKVIFTYIVSTVPRQKLQPYSSGPSCKPWWVCQGGKTACWKTPLGDLSLCHQAFHHPAQLLGHLVVDLALHLPLVFSLQAVELDCQSTHPSSNSWERWSERWSWRWWCSRPVGSRHHLQCCDSVMAEFRTANSSIIYWS